MYPAKEKAYSSSLQILHCKQNRQNKFKVPGQTGRVQLRILFYAASTSQKTASKGHCYIAASFGIKKQLRLVHGVIPMVFKRPDTSSSTPSHSSQDCSSSLKRAVALHNEGNKPPKKRQALERSRVSAVYHVNSYVTTYSYSINLAIYVIDGIN